MMGMNEPINDVQIMPASGINGFIIISVFSKVSKNYNMFDM